MLYRDNLLEPVAQRKFVQGVRALSHRSHHKPPQDTAPTGAIAIDLQCLQTETRDRGIGTYTKGLLEGLVQTSPLPIVGMLNAFMGLDPTVLPNNLRDTANFFLTVFGQDTPFSGQYRPGRERQEKDYRRKIAALEPRVLIVPSAFQRRWEVVPTPSSGLVCPVVYILHDLIPWQFPSAYLRSRRSRESYTSGLARVRQADLVLCNSDSTQELWSKVKPSSQPSVAIGAGGVIDTPIRPKPLSSRSGVVVLSGNTWNKNPDEAVEGYLRLPVWLRAKETLTISGITDPGLKRRLLSRLAQDGASASVIGQVTRSQIDELLSKSRVLMMSSRVEGLGLPILEAISFGTPSVVPDTMPLASIASRSYKAGDPKSLSEQLSSLLENDDDWMKASAECALHKPNFTWQATARRLLNALELW